MDNTITFWEPQQKTFYVLSLLELRDLLMWGYDLEYKQVEQIGADLYDGEYWSSIQTEKIEEEDIVIDFRVVLLKGHRPAWDILLEDLSSKGKIPPGDYLLSVY